ncbi:hypothetical protein SAFG77S_08250 [Streptomyces afghaniensis]
MSHTAIPSTRPAPSNEEVPDGPPELCFSDREIIRSSNYLSMRIRLERLS